MEFHCLSNDLLYKGPLGLHGLNYVFVYEREPWGSNILVCLILRAPARDHVELCRRTYGCQSFQKKRKPRCCKMFERLNEEFNHRKNAGRGSLVRIPLPPLNEHNALQEARNGKAADEPRRKTCNNEAFGISPSAKTKGQTSAKSRTCRHWGFEYSAGKT